MNILNVVLSGIVSAIFSYFSIINFSYEQNNLKNFIKYFFLLFILDLFVCIFFDSITKLLLNINLLSNLILSL